MRDEGCAISQIKKLRAALSGMFATAVDDNLLRSSPVQGIRIPAPLEDEAPGKSKGADPGRVGGPAGGDPGGAGTSFFEFLIHMGLRISEAVGLRWEHIDLGEKPNVKIREQFYRGKRRRLKSGAGRRGYHYRRTGERAAPRKSQPGFCWQGKLPHSDPGTGGRRRDGRSS
jgi:integrase